MAAATDAHTPHHFYPPSSSPSTPGVDIARTKDVRQIPAALIESSTAALFGYRVNCASTSAVGQLILPESLKLLPLYITAMTRHPAFLQNSSQPRGTPSPGGPFGDVTVRCDRRAMELAVLNGIPAHRILSTLYPRIYRLDDVGEDSGLCALPTGSGGGGGESPSLAALARIHLPHISSQGPFLSQEFILPEGVYVLETTKRILVLIGANTPLATLRDLFNLEAGVTSATSLPARPPLPRKPNPTSQRLWAAITCICARRILACTASTELPVTVIAPGDPTGKGEVCEALVEDRLPGTGASASSAGPNAPSNARSYVEVLCAIHSAIQQQLTNN